LAKGEVRIGETYLKDQCNFYSWNLNSLIQGSSEYMPDETLFGVKNLIFKQHFKNFIVFVDVIICPYI